MTKKGFFFLSLAHAIVMVTILFFFLFIIFYINKSTRIVPENDLILYCKNFQSITFRLIQQSIFGKDEERFFKESGIQTPYSYKFSRKNWKWIEVSANFGVSGSFIHSHNKFLNNIPQTSKTSIFCIHKNLILGDEN